MESEVIGSLVNENNAWIKDTEIEVNERGRVYVYSGLTKLERYEVLGQGSYGIVYMYGKDEKRCAVKIVQDEIERGYVGNAEYRDAIESIGNCLVVYTKIFYAAPDFQVQVMELGDMTGIGAAKSGKVGIREYEKFSVYTAQCVLWRGLCAMDMKLDNVVCIKQKTYFGVESPLERHYFTREFRIVDIDGLTACMMHDLGDSIDEDDMKTYEITAPDALYLDGVVASFPIFKYLTPDFTACPALMIVQTWYAFIVSVVAYIGYGMRNRRLEFDIMQELRFDGNIRYYKPDAIFSTEHPLYKLIMRWQTYAFPEQEQQMAITHVKMVLDDFIERIPSGQNQRPGRFKSNNIYFGCKKMVIPAEETQVYRMEEYKEQMQYTRAVLEAVLTNFRIYDYLLSPVITSTTMYVQTI